MFPCNHAIWSKWAPPLERTTLVTMAISGETARSLPSLDIGVAAIISSLVKFLVELLVHDVL